MNKRIIFFCGKWPWYEGDEVLPGDRHMETGDLKFLKNQLRKMLQLTFDTTWQWAIQICFLSAKSANHMLLESTVLVLYCVSNSQKLKK